MASSTPVTTVIEPPRAPATTTLERGRRVLRMESEAIAEAARRLDDAFEKAVEMIAQSPGRVIVCGVGKSGLIARKIAATMTSTGTPAVFLHPADSAHGDLGIVGESDVAVLISKSGDSDELVSLLDQVKRFGVRTIAMTANPTSALATHAEVVLDAWVREEACPHDLAPTTSTAVALALGDALAIALLEQKGFAAADFARLHPGGALGRKMLTTVREVMVDHDLPVLPPTATMREAIVQIAHRRGLAIVIDPTHHVRGVITAGDLTRLMEREANVMPVPVSQVMNASPKLAQADELGSAVVHRMEQHGIMAMPVVDSTQLLIGVVHLHDLIRAGVV
ncbi:MAG TPA: KpsF/GutQ family sugar-phosphate isomerase [Gemmatimonadaceae bacterium]|jgi:arabinose-5-phosphate isomerase|nr:KpsF/GutQ family sugar-phosphate isomerase [Gemmatimonadaceae bacterium]